MAEILNTGASLPEGTPAPEGHDAAMIAKVDEVEKNLQDQQKAPEAPTPEKILGKFDSIDDLTKAYEELERKLGAPKDPEETPKAEEPAPEQAAEQAVESAGLDMGALEAKYAEKGSLEDSDYEALEKAGITRQTVDNYIAGQEAQGLLLRNEVFNSVGGEEQFNAIAEWASSNLTADELQRYNAAIDSNDMNAVKSAVEVVSMKYTAAMGKEPSLLNGDNGNSSSADVFMSTAQLTAAMSDPRYETDPAYRDAVAAKLGRSGIL